MSGVKRLAKRVAKSLGLIVIRHNSVPLGPSTSAALLDTVDLNTTTYDYQAEAVDLLRTAAPYTMTSLERMMSLYQICRHVERRGLEGDLVECGVWRGGSAGIMAGVNLKHGRARRTLWLYDSFEGIPQPKAVDGAGAAQFADGRAAGELVSTNKLVAPESHVLELMSKLKYPREHVHIIKGWFQDTVPVTQPKRIAVLRLDGDWYESTKVCIDHLFPLVIENGFVVIDDYGDWEGCKKAIDQYFDQHGLMPMLHHVDRTCRYFIKTTER